MSQQEPIFAYINRQAKNTYNDLVTTLYDGELQPPDRYQAICQFIMMIFKKPHREQNKDSTPPNLANNEQYHYSKELADILNANKSVTAGEVAQNQVFVQEDSDTTLGRHSKVSETTHSKYKPSKATNTISPNSIKRPSRTERKTASAEPIPEEISAEKGYSTAKPPETALILGTDIGQSHRDTSTASGFFVDTGVNKGLQSPLQPIHLKQNQLQLLRPSKIPTRRGNNSPISLYHRNLINQKQMQHMLNTLLDTPLEESTEFNFEQNDRPQTQDANIDDPKDPDDDSSEDSDESSESSQESDDRSSTENNSQNSKDQWSNNNVTDFNCEDVNRNHQEVNNQEDVSFHPQNSETLSNQQNKSGGKPNEDRLISTNDLNNIGKAVPKDIQTTVNKLDQRMDNDLEELQNTHKNSWQEFLDEKQKSMFKAVRKREQEMVDCIEARELILRTNIDAQEEICVNTYQR